MEKISIYLSNNWNYDFHTDSKEIKESEPKVCYYCGIYLDKTYSYIIDQLKKGNLLDKKYKLICCYCKVLEKFGLLDLRNKLDRIFYSEAYDILNLEFVLKRYMEKLGILYIRIHDYSKIREV